MWSARRVGLIRHLIVLLGVSVISCSKLTRGSYSSAEKSEPEDVPLVEGVRTFPHRETLEQAWGKGTGDAFSSIFPQSSSGSLSLRGA